MIQVFYCIVYRRRWPNGRIRTFVTGTITIRGNDDVPHVAEMLVAQNLPKGWVFEHITIVRYTDDQTIYERNA